MVILSTTLGASLYENDRKKLRILSLVLMLIEEIYTDIRYTGSTVEEILISCAKNPMYKQLKFLQLAKNEIQEGRLSNSSLKNAIKTDFQGLNLNEDALLPLYTLADKLGTTDTTGQLQMLEGCKLQILQLRSLQNDRCNTLGKMYISLGLLLGIGTAVILA